MKWIASTIRTYHRIEDTRLDQQPLVSMAGTPKNELNKIRMDMMKRDNFNEVAQDGVESTASQLQGGRLVGGVDDEARTCYERVKEMIVYLLYLLYSASFGLKVVLSNPSNKGNYERVEIETNEINTFSGSGENKSKEEEASASVGMEIVLPTHSNKENYERDKTNESNTFSSRGENKNEEERTSKDQEGCENKTNSWSSYDKTKSGEYVLSRPPKKPGGREADEGDTTTTVSCGTTSTWENINSTITNNLEHWKGPTIVRMENVRTESSTDREKENTPETLRDIEEELAQDLGLTRPQLLFKTGHQLKELSDRKVQTTWEKVNAVAIANQREAEKDLARVRKLAARMEKTSEFRRIKYMPPGLNKNESKETSADKSKVIKFTRKPNQSKPPWETQKGASVFVFGNVKAKKTLVDFNKVSNVPNITQKGGSFFAFGNVKTKKTLGDSDKVSNVPSKRRRRRRRRRKVDQFALRYQELEIEKDKRKQRRHSNWKKRHRSKIGRVTKVRALNILLVEMMPHPKRKRKGTNRPICTTTKVRRQSNKKERVTIKVKKRPLRRIYLLKKEELCMLCLEKRQQSSPAVMFARLRSNRRYKPGD